MNLTPVFQRQLALFNRTHPNHPDVVLWYNPRSVKARWVTKLNGVPIKHWRYQGRWEVGVEMRGRPKGYGRTLKYLGSGRWFLKLFTWYRAVSGRDGGFLPPDARVFQALSLMDTTRAEHYERTVEQPEEEREREKHRVRTDRVKGGVDYYKKHDNLIVPVGSTDTKGRRDWRTPRTR